MTIAEFFDLLDNILRDQHRAVISAEQAEAERRALIDFFERQRA